MTRRALGVLTLLPALMLSATACGGDEPTESASEETSETASESPSETESEEPTDDASEAPDTEAPGDADDEPEMPQGNAFEGDGYAFAAPATWRDATERFAPMSPLIDLGLLESKSDNPVFSDNINVIVDPPYPAFTPEQAEKQFLRELDQVATQGKVLPRVEIDDRGAVHLSGRTSIGKAKVYTEQYAAYVDETWYIITFSHAPDTTSAEREQDMSTVLDSWVWTEGDDA